MSSLMYEDPNRMMLKEQFAAADINQRQLQKEREDERIINQLFAEFQRMDYNQDGVITLPELRKFINLQTNGSGNASIVESIF